ncbi:MAG: epoxyqueuosine reductase QueH [Lachnospiraceae bacterium]|nr:epoxyqueuosine reductase QueH [Lachnospiraceae bacterium]
MCLLTDEEILTLPKDNFQKKTDEYIRSLQERGVRGKLLLHSCCAPCSSYCLEYLRKYFDITDYFYNPNITNTDEYEKRAGELGRLISEYNKSGVDSIEYVTGRYAPEEFIQAVRGLENEPEGGLRCVKCFRLRLYETAGYAAENGFDCFTTTLTISPLKNASVLNYIGQEAAEKFGIYFLPSDFKKRGGYQRSIELSREYNLYRQDYCGCVFSKTESERRKQP